MKPAHTVCGPPLPLLPIKRETLFPSGCGRLGSGQMRAMREATDFNYVKQQRNWLNIGAGSCALGYP